MQALPAVFAKMLDAMFQKVDDGDLDGALKIIDALKVKAIDADREDVWALLERNAKEIRAMQNQSSLPAIFTKIFNAMFPKT